VIKHFSRELFFISLISSIWFLGILIVRNYSRFILMLLFCFISESACDNISTSHILVVSSLLPTLFLIHFFLLKLICHSFVIKLVFILKSILGKLSYWYVVLFRFHCNDVKLRILFVKNIVLVEWKRVCTIRWKVGLVFALRVPLIKQNVPLGWPYLMLLDSFTFFCESG
jgi:hypothetical protein